MPREIKKKKGKIMVKSEYNLRMPLFFSLDDIFKATNYY